MVLMISQQRGGMEPPFEKALALGATQLPQEQKDGKTQY
jgi:hypothetical protein